MIYTVTPNPTLDIIWGMSGWEHGSATRVTDIMESSGGRDLNVARVADQLSASVCVLSPLDGMTGGRIRGLFANLTPRVRTHWVASPVPAHRSVVLVDKQVSIFNEAGQAPPCEVWPCCAEFLASVFTPNDVCTICGSLLGDSCVSDITPIFEAVKVSSTYIILNTSGTALVDAASYADVLRPDEHELQAIAGYSIIDEGACILLGLEAPWVFISRGADDMDLYSYDGSRYASGDSTITGNPTRAGDTTVTTIAMHLEKWLPVAEGDGVMAPIDAVTTSMATVVYPTAGEIDVGIHAGVFQPTVPVRLLPLPIH